MWEGNGKSRLNKGFFYFRLLCVLHVQACNVFSTPIMIPIVCDIFVYIHLTLRVPNATPTQYALSNVWSKI